MRTDENYRNLTDEDHHLGATPLVDVLDLVTQVPFEAMHILWLGNVKKEISANIIGKFDVRRMSARRLAILDSEWNSFRYTVLPTSTDGPEK